MFFGVPWQYDTYVVHDGRLNQYTLWVNERKKILFPLIESLDEVNCTAVRICMVNGKKFEKEMKKNQFFFAIIPRKSSCTSSSQVTKNSGDQVTASDS
jgi:hypothetical protein